MLRIDAPLVWADRDTVEVGDTVWVLLHPEEKSFLPKVAREGRVTHKQVPERVFEPGHITIEILNHDGCAAPGPRESVLFLTDRVGKALAKELLTTTAELEKLRPLKYAIDDNGVGRLRAYDRLVSAFREGGGINITLQLPASSAQPKVRRRWFWQRREVDLQKN